MGAADREIGTDVSIWLSLLELGYLIFVTVLKQSNRLELRFLNFSVYVYSHYSRTAVSILIRSCSQSFPYILFSWLINWIYYITRFFRQINGIRMSLKTISKYSSKIWLLISFLLLMFSWLCFLLNNIFLISYLISVKLISSWVIVKGWERHTDGTVYDYFLLWRLELQLIRLLLRLLFGWFRLEFLLFIIFRLLYVPPMMFWYFLLCKTCSSFSKCSLNFFLSIFIMKNSLNIYWNLSNRELINSMIWMKTRLFIWIYLDFFTAYSLFFLHSNS